MIETTLACPHCKSPFTIISSKSIQCPSKHNFDFAKDGSLYLLPVNQRKSKNPGDNKLMIEARRAFLDKEHFFPLTKVLKNIIIKQLSTANNLAALDLGCGEGHYTHKVLEEVPQINQIFGTDISKAAIKAAAKKYKEMLFFVSSAFNLPIQDQSINLILSVFAPIDSSEIQRVLKKNGYALIVTAGSNHLHQLAEMIYDNFKPHKQTIDDKMNDQFIKVHSQDLKFDLHLNKKEDILNLLKMTPYYWNNDGQKMEKLEALKNLDVTCDFKINLFRPSLPE